MNKKIVLYLPFLFVCVCIYTILIVGMVQGSKISAEHASLIRNCAFCLLCILYLGLLIVMPIYAKKIDAKTLLLYGFITKILLVPFYLFVFFLAIVSLPLSFFMGFVMPLGWFAGPIFIVLACIVDFLLLLLTSLYVVKGIKKFDGMKGKAFLVAASFFYILDVVVPVIALAYSSAIAKKKQAVL